MISRNTALTNDSCDCGSVANGETCDKNAAQLHLVLVVDVVGPLDTQRNTLIRKNNIILNKFWCETEIGKKNLEITLGFEPRSFEY